MLNEQERRDIAAAVAAAEARTSGEIICVVARRVSGYPEIPLAWAAAVALILPPLAVAFGARPLALSPMFGEWMVGHVSAADANVAGAIGAYAVLQAGLFLLAWLVFGLPAVRRLLTPGFVKTARVRQAAMSQYLATGLAARDDITGVVIFASLEDHRVELVAEPQITERCAAGVWDEAVAAITSAMREGRPAAGFVTAIGICGDALAAHFPDDGGANLAPDEPVVI